MGAIVGGWAIGKRRPRLRGQPNCCVAVNDAMCQLPP
jgi:hypothetical protein